MMGLILLLILLSGASHAESVEELLRSLLKQDQVCSLDDVDPLTYFETDETKVGPKKVTCPSDERIFFGNIHRTHCSHRFGSSGFTCVENDQAKVKARIHNTNLFNKMTSYTQSKFTEYKENLAEECCGDKEVCRTRFKQVNLEITKEEAPSASYDSNSTAVNSSVNRIRITAGKIASAYNTENLDRVLLVELAHACQFAINAENATDYAAFTGPQRCDKESGLIGFKEGLGEELSSCLIDEVESQIKELSDADRSKFCFGKWYREVFSDMKFRKHYTSIYHWTYDMGRRTPATNYASVYKYIRCGFPESLKKKLCE